MTNKKQRMSMLDNLSAAPSTSAPTGSRAVRAARDAVDAYRVWELDPDHIDTGNRIKDRLDDAGIEELRDAVEQNGQAVPILVRRNPSHQGRYLLVYGYRRLMAIRGSEKVEKIKALIATIGDDDALRTQISENTARRDLSYIEKALFARELVDSGFGTQAQVAEVLTISKSSISMALNILELVGPELVRAIGPAHSIGRPRWEALGRAIKETGLRREALVETADRARALSESAVIKGKARSDDDPSLIAFEAVQAALSRNGVTVQSSTAKPAHPTNTIALSDGRVAKVSRHTKGLRMEIGESDFADWLEQEAGVLLNELYRRWRDQRR